VIGRFQGLLLWLDSAVTKRLKWLINRRRPKLCPDNIINYEVLHKTLSSTRLYNIIALVRHNEPALPMFNEAILSRHRG
jgi:hypothetical protein